MNLRDLNIASRLGLGFGLILLASSLMLALALAISASHRSQLQDTLRSAAQRERQAASMQQQLLAAAVAIRNVGLQTDVAGTQKEEAQARIQRQGYLAAKVVLEAHGLSDAERARMTRLADIDSQMDKHFKEAVGLATSFNTEQAALVITKKIDPLLNLANRELGAFIGMQQESAEQASSAADAAFRDTERVTIGAALLVVLASTALAWRLTVSITRPLKTAELAAARVAAGDLGFELDISGNDEAARLLGALGAMRGSLAAIVANVRQNSESVATASAEIAQGNGDLSVRTEHQASALQQTASSMQELGRAVGANADNAARAKALAEGASSVARKGGEVVGRVVETMKGINDSSKRIAEILGVIDGIAFQTNILALNAAVEAARAGEQGRGFAVVASEVRTLAQRCANAAREIKSLISTSVERVDQGSRLVDQAGTTIQDIVAAITQVADIVTHISGGSAEQHAGLQQVSQAVQAMDSVTQQNAALVEEGSAAAESLRAQAAALVAVVAVFKLSAQPL